VSIHRTPIRVYHNPPKYAKLYAKFFADFFFVMIYG